MHEIQAGCDYNLPMILIRPLREEDVPAVKRVILTVAYNMFGFDGTLKESIRHYEAQGKLSDVDEFQAHYFDRGGYFLVALNGRQVIGSAALRKLDDTTAELKRMWLLEAYHRQGIGYQLITRLFAFARQHGYACVRLQTSSGQTRALTFYRQVGFHEISAYNPDEDDIAMEILL